jgi:hypothetical protein
MSRCHEFNGVWGMKKIIPILAVGVALMLGGCGRDPGPAGPKGETGAQGPAGPQGAQGVQADGAISCEATETLVSVVCPSGGAPDGTKCTTTPTVGLCLKK